MRLVSTAVILVLIRSAAALAETPQVPFECYTGSVTVNIVNEDGTAARNADVALFGMILWQEPDAQQPHRRRRIQADETGTWHTDATRECEAPTFIYAWNDAAQTAGFTLVRDLRELAHPQWVRMRDACRLKVRFEAERPPNIACTEPFFWINVAPRGVMSREIRWIIHRPRDAQIEVLLPPGEYTLLAQGYQLQRISLDFTVSPRMREYDLGTLKLAVEGSLRLIEQPAPELHVVEWSDGGCDRSIRDFLGAGGIVYF